MVFIHQNLFKYYCNRSIHYIFFTNDYVLPISLIMIFTISNFVRISVYQYVYFYLITYYLNIKLKSINDKIRNVVKNNYSLSSSLMLSIMKSINKIYNEIKDCNGNYWSLYIFFHWLLFTTLINTSVYLAIFTHMLIMRIVFTFCTCVFILDLIITIRSAASVNLEANKSYKLLYLWCAIVVLCGVLTLSFTSALIAC